MIPFRKKIRQVWLEPSKWPDDYAPQKSAGLQIFLTNRRAKMSEKQSNENEFRQGEEVEAGGIVQENEIQHLVGYIASLNQSTERLLNHQVRDESKLELVSLARVVERFHQIKQQSLGAVLSALGEPVWKILIQLVIATEEEQNISVGEIARRISLPETTTLRYLNILEKEGYIFQSAHQGDMLDGQLYLTKQGHILMEDTLLALTAT